VSERNKIISLFQCQKAGETCIMRSCRDVGHTKYHQSVEIKNEMREECGAQGGEGKCIQGFDGEL